MRILVVLVAVAALWFLLRKSKAAGASVDQGGGGVPLGGSGSDALDNMTEALARMEGFYVSGSLPQRTNNPGDIGTFGGAVKAYDDAGDGWDHLTNYVSNASAANPSWDFYDFFRFYLTGDTMGVAGPKQNPDGYADFVSNYMGVDPTQSVSSVLNGG